MYRFYVRKTKPSLGRLDAHARGRATAHSRSAVLNLWAAVHWWAADLCLVGRDEGWELRIFYVSHVSQSMKRYQVLVLELELLLHT